MNWLEKKLNCCGFILVPFIFFSIFTLLGYGFLLNDLPQSKHFWRQSDGAAIALNYFTNGMQFFKPEILHQLADNNQSGYAVGEFPILYYLVAILYHIFGYHIWVGRLFFFTLSAFGAFALYKIFHGITHKAILSLVLCFFIVFNPLLVLYNSTFIPDISALNLSLIAWYLLLRYWQMFPNDQTVKQRYFYWGITLILFASLIKLSAVSSLFIVIILFLLKGLKYKPYQIRFPVNRSVIIVFSVSFFVLITWYLWAKNYNVTHGNSYFAMRPCPIWDYEVCSHRSIVEIFRAIKKDLYPIIFSPVIFYMLVLGLLIQIIFIKKTSAILSIIVGLLIMATLAFFTLFFGALYEHDYYLITLYLLPVFIMLNTIYVIKQWVLPKYDRWVLPVLFMLLISHLLYTSRRKSDFFETGYNDYYRMFKVLTIEKNTINHFVPKESKVVIVPDETPNFSLLLLERKGWTYHPVKPNFEGHINQYKIHGAQYLVLMQAQQQLLDHPEYVSFTDSLVYQHPKFSIYFLSQ